MSSLNRAHPRLTHNSHVVQMLSIRERGKTLGWVSYLNLGSSRKERPWGGQQQKKESLEELDFQKEDHISIENANNIFYLRIEKNKFLPTCSNENCI